MEITLKGKNALIGGSSKGIGLAIAKRLAASGASVTLMARNESLLAEIIPQLETQLGQTHQYLVVDFSDFSSFSSRIDNFLKKNEIDILINNTQGPPAGGALDQTLKDYQQAFDLLFKCAVYTSGLVLPKMQKKQWGRIINVGSISVKEPLNNLVLSNSIRAALVSWAKTLAADTAADQITVNTILTGYFDTERINQLNQEKAKKLGTSTEKVHEAMENSVPARRFGKPEEFANLVCFLASKQASYITGTNIPIDGGLLKSM